MYLANTWIVSVTELLGHFRDALAALVPIAERVHMPWQEPQNYDDWDAIASTLYNSIVIGSIVNSDFGRSCLPIPQYDKRLTSYGNNSLISCTELSFGHAFLCLETASDPFDTCVFAVLDNDLRAIDLARVAFHTAEFELIGRTAKNSNVAKQVNVVL